MAGLDRDTSDQESLVRLLPAGAIRPLARIRQGRYRPDQGVPRDRDLELSRRPEIGTSEGQGMNQAHRRQRRAGRTPRVGNTAGPQVRVTLSDDLLNHLRRTAQAEHVSLRWLVAGLVCDTIKSESGKDQVPRAGCGGR